VIRERLGTDESLDYLGLSFSAVDLVGHRYGPHSREVLDTVLRLDHTLDGLLTFLDERVGRSHLLVALSADHGVAPMPERQQRVGLPGMRQSPMGIACVQSVLGKLDAAYGERDWFQDSLYLDASQVARSRVPRADLDRRVVASLSTCPGVARVWTRAELSPDKLSGDRFLDLERASYLPSRSPDYVIQWAPGYVDRASGTTHGSPYGYDTHVPLVLRVPGVPGRIVRTPVATADLAPTLATLLGLRAPYHLDGRDRSALFLPKR
jgi:predicted AlkP superfamily pyrophosphatase or phosphodiesterase